MIVEAHFPEKLQALAEKHAYYILYGGRGGSKSWGCARRLLIDGVNQPLRILCARETMTSIADSVHQLLCDQIHELNLGAYYTIQKTSIEGRNGTQFAFAGLRHNVNHLGGLGLDILYLLETGR